jgi:hypothetical protein
MNKMVVGAALAAGLGLAGFAGAGVASALPTVDNTVSCTGGCVVKAAEEPTGPQLQPWNALFAADPWGKVFDPNGDGKGAWEQGVQAVNGGAWESVFGEAP